MRQGRPAVSCVLRGGMYIKIGWEKICVSPLQYIVPGRTWRIIVFGALATERKVQGNCGDDGTDNVDCCHIEFDQRFWILMSEFGWLRNEERVLGECGVGPTATPP